MADIKPAAANTSLYDQGIFHFAGDVNIESAKAFTAFVLDHNTRKTKVSTLTLIITSNGGDVAASFAMTDIIHGSAIPVRTIGLGIIASCGLLMFMSGAKGERILTPNTAILSHQFSGATWGKEHELVAARRRHDLVSDRIVRHYKKHTGLTEKKIREFLLPAEDRWLTPEQAKELNLCDQIRLVSS